MTRLVYIQLLLLVVSSSICQIRELDSLQTLLNKEKKELARIDLLNELSFRIFKNNPEESLKFAEEALRLSRRERVAAGELKAENNLALYHVMKGKPEIALQHALSAVAIAEREHLNELLAYSYSVLATIYTNQSQTGKAINYLQQASALNKEGGNVITACRILNSYGGIARDAKNYDSALACYSKAIGLMKKSREYFLMPEVLNNIGIVYLRQNKLKQALEFLEQSSDEARKVGNVRAELLSKINIANVFIEKKMYARAEELAQELLTLSKKIGDKKKTLQIYLTLATIKMETGAFHEAHQLMTEHYSLRDSLLNESKNQQMAELEARYETEKKIQTIKSLELQKAMQSEKQWYLTVCIIILLAGSGIVFYLQRSHNKKVRELLEVQRALNSKLRASDETKSRFYATISHEFRTPLTLITVPLEEKLSSAELSASDKKTFQLIKRNANRLLTLTSQLLDLSKLEAGKMELNLQNGDLKKLLTIVTSSFDSYAENRKIHFVKDISLDLKLQLFDADKLEKIVNNLLSNAFKFTPSGGTVSFSVHHAPDRNGIDMKIGDTGKGIAKEDQPHIFSPFYQSKYNPDDGRPGTGLGLSLVNELIKLYEGTISFESQEGLGTTFFVSLPIKENFSEESIGEAEYTATSPLLSDQFNADAVEERDQYDNQLLDDSILIVEDNEELRNFISDILKNQFKILKAKDGEEGLRLAVEHIPNLIISDVMMPKLDGIQFLRGVKADERSSHIPVILLTAKADIESRLEGLTFGADDYLAKPFNPDELRVRIINLIEQRKKLAQKYRIGFIAPPVPNRELSADEKFLMRARGIVDKHLSNSSFGVEQMADEMHLSRAQLFRKLKAITALSPNEFINDIRLQKAAELILAKADTLTQIGYAVGYNEQSYFTKRFRKKFGVAPSEYTGKTFSEIDKRVR